MTAQRDGSLIVDMWLAWADQRNDLIGIISSEGASAVANSAELAAVVIAGLRWIINGDRSGDERSVEPITSGQIRVSWADGAEIEAPIQAQLLIEAWTSIALRVRSRTASAGRRREDRSQGRQSARDRPPRRSARVQHSARDPNVISDNTRVVTVRVETLGMNPGNRWRAR